MQAAWRAMIGKDPILDQNPLESDTTIPEEVWDRRYQNREPEDLEWIPEGEEFLTSIFAKIDLFRRKIKSPDYDYFPDLIQLLGEIENIRFFSTHKQMAMELTNYVKKLIRRQFHLPIEEARSLEQRIRHAMSTREPTLPSVRATVANNGPLKEIGAGGFGTVLRPALPNINNTGALQEFPKNVTKIFYKKEDLDKILGIAPLLPEIMGPNEGHRMTSYKRTIKGRNIPVKTRRNLSVGDESDLFALRMPYLGTTIGLIKNAETEIRRLPFLTLIVQMRKVLTQVQTLFQHDYIHGDIRDSNVMIDPLTGTITIIDFDLLSRTDSFGISGAYNNPPEVLIGDLSNQEKISYLNNSYRLFSHFQELYPNKTAFKVGMIDAIKQNRVLKNRVGREIFGHLFFATFDSFGLACTLLRLLKEVYPGSIYSTKAELKVLLSITTQNQVRPYTEDQLNACTDAMYAMIHGVLLPLATIELRVRKKIPEVMDTVVMIETNLRTAMGPVNHVAGKRRRTRRSSKK